MYDNPIKSDRICLIYIVCSRVIRDKKLPRPHNFSIFGSELNNDFMKNQYTLLKNVSGWVVFAITLIVFASTAERSGSLWDVGEFIAGAYKLQVVHPPGAPLFLLVG